MQTIDGSQGEGGGQILRSSLAFAMVTGQSCRIENIRAGRKKPGLMRQHLTAVRAAQAVSGATVVGDEIGSTQIEFAVENPGRVSGGEYHFSIGTAGSTTLVLQTVLPALMLADGPSVVVLEGGTHNPFAPPFDFLVRAFLPALEKMGPKVRATLDRPGFYPAGGGRLSVTIEPVKKLGVMEWLERGETVRRSATATVANLSREIAERELKVVRKKLNWADECLVVNEVCDTPGPGNILTLEVESDGGESGGGGGICEVFTGFGEMNRPAEVVAKQAVQACQRYLSCGVPVGEYLADQLLLPMAIAGGGAFRCVRLTRHTQTHIELVQKFLDCQITTESHGRDGVIVRVS